MNLIEKLKAKNIEVTQEMEEILAGDFISVQEHERKIKRVEEERDKFKKDFETASETLKGFEGKDFEAIQKERDEWKEKYETADKDYKQQIYERDFCIYRRERYSWIYLRYEGEEDGYPWIFYLRVNLHRLPYS